MSYSLSAWQWGLPFISQYGAVSNLFLYELVFVPVCYQSIFDDYKSVNYSSLN